MMKCNTFIAHNTAVLDEQVNRWLMANPKRKPVKSHFCAVQMVHTGSGEHKILFTTQIFHIFKQDADVPDAEGEGKKSGMKP